MCVNWCCSSQYTENWNYDAAQFIYDNDSLTFRFNSLTRTELANDKNSNVIHFKLQIITKCLIWCWVVRLSESLCVSVAYWLNIWRKSVNSCFTHSHWTFWLVIFPTRWGSWSLAFSWRQLELKFDTKKIEESENTHLMQRTRKEVNERLKLYDNKTAIDD